MKPGGYRPPLPFAFPIMPITDVPFDNTKLRGMSWYYVACSAAKVPTHDPSQRHFSRLWFDDGGNNVLSANNLSAASAAICTLRSSNILSQSCLARVSSAGSEAGRVAAISASASQDRY